MLMRARWVASGCAAQSERAGFAAQSERPRCLLGAQLAIIVVPPFVYSLPAMTNTSTEMHALARSVTPHPHHCRVVHLFFRGIWRNEEDGSVDERQ